MKSAEMFQQLDADAEKVYKAWKKFGDGMQKIAERYAERRRAAMTNEEERREKERRELCQKNYAAQLEDLGYNPDGEPVTAKYFRQSNRQETPEQPAAQEMPKKHETPEDYTAFYKQTTTNLIDSADIVKALNRIPAELQQITKNLQGLNRIMKEVKTELKKTKGGRG